MFHRSIRSNTDRLGQHIKVGEASLTWLNTCLAITSLERCCGRQLENNESKFFWEAVFLRCVFKLEPEWPEWDNDQIFIWRAGHPPEWGKHRVELSGSRFAKHNKLHNENISKCHTLRQYLTSNSTKAQAALSSFLNVVLRSLVQSGTTCSPQRRISQGAPVSTWHAALPAYVLPHTAS